MVCMERDGVAMWVRSVSSAMWWYIFERTEMKIEVCCLREYYGYLSIYRLSIIVLDMWQ